MPQLDSGRLIRYGCIRPYYGAIRTVLEQIQFHGLNTDLIAPNRLKKKKRKPSEMSFPIELQDVKKENR